MYVKLPPRDLNLNLPPTPSQIFNMCGVTIMPRVHDGFDWIGTFDDCWVH